MGNYRPILPNEVTVSLRNIKRIFADKRVFVLGYGSLLYPEGWGRRNMKATVSAKDLIECRADGFKRGPFGLCHGIHFYGAIHDDDCRINGVLVEIQSWKDWAELMATELIAGMFLDYNYRVCDVTHNVNDVILPRNAAVHMVCNEPENEKESYYNWPCPNYYESVARGVERSRSKEFRKEFHATGGYTLKQALSLSQRTSRLSYYYNPDEFNKSIKE